MEIGEDAFEYCETLREIVIPNSVVNMEDNAFYGCDDKFVLVVQRDSYAERYAKENGMNYVYFEVK